jgi:hypothetical protein
MGNGFVCTAALIRIQSDMAMGCEDGGGARGGYNNKDKNDILMPHARERKPVIKTDNSPVMP